MELMWNLEPMKETIRAIPSGLLNAKYLIFDTPNIKNQPSLDISNLKIFDMQLQYTLNYEMVQTKMPKFLFLLYLLFLSSPNTNLSLRLVLSLNSHLCLALFVALSQPRRSHHNDHDAALPSFVPSTTSCHTNCSTSITGWPGHLCQIQLILYWQKR